MTVDREIQNYEKDPQPSEEVARADAAEPGVSESESVTKKPRESTLPADLPRLDEESEVTQTSELEVVRTEHAALAARLLERPHKSAMLRVTGRLLRLIGSILFTHVLFGQRNRDNLRDVAETGTPVYVMQSRSFLDYLYFNYLFLKNDLPLAQYANGVNTNWVRGPFAWLKQLFRRKPAEAPELCMQALVENNQAAFLFLEESKKGAEENYEFSQKYLTRLIHAQKHSARPIIVVPLLLVWEKRPDPKRAGLIQEVFGTPQRPGFFRKFLSFFQTFWQSFFKIGQPMVQISTTLNLESFLREYPHAGSADASELLRARLLNYLERERSVILGPTGEAPEVLYKQMINRPALIEAVREMAAEEGVDEAVIRERVREQFDEIAASPSPLMLKIWASVLSFVWYRIYDGLDLDTEGLEKVKEAARDSSIVLIPSHKSHVDYLVMSYIMYNYGMVTPLVAAGVNLSFWPMGPLFRWAGGFFIRRTFRGEKLYPLVFREYLISQMEEGYPIEFFIEGTRSRTGKLIKPKYGMLEMIIRAYTSGRIDSLKLVPISVGYERIIEERSYRRELLGGEKQKEGITGLLKTPKFLTSKYGRLYIEFGDPISLGDYLDLYEIDHLRPSDEDMDAVTVRLAHRIIYEINHVATVTPTALAAMALLSNISLKDGDADSGQPAGISRRLLLDEVGFILHLLINREEPARISGTLTEGLEEFDAQLAALRSAGARARWPSLDKLSGNDSRPSAAGGLESVMGDAVESVIEEAIGLFTDNKQVRVERVGDDVFYSVPEESRPELAYYRNNIVHYFVAQALLASAVRKFKATDISMAELMEETRFLSKLFKFEWIYEERAQFENVFLRTLRGFEAAGWVEVEGFDGFKDDQDPREAVVGARVRIPDPFPAELNFFARLVASLLEAYALVVEMVAQSEARWERDALIKKALKKSRADYAAGQIFYYESISKPTFKNAVRLLDDWAAIEKISVGKKASALAYSPSEDWDRARFDALTGRLRSFL
ncbi:glycerol-3-phosphate acyltransferase [Bradymonas sediminis]|uniref:Uncharacterized protein n=1 Tax=Bradymonas sediminis TaxID=1548548 RepID=A0A2Z4FP31_9DELT|nr:hypothetical protein DN745_15390 [Bradymonas sediminis]TDP62367.1 glycerol-3-phosphate acyltransferase [Bradymonas sediminis]